MFCYIQLLWLLSRVLVVLCTIAGTSLSQYKCTSRWCALRLTELSFPFNRISAGCRLRRPGARLLVADCDRLRLMQYFLEADDADLLLTCGHAQECVSSHEQAHVDPAALQSLECWEGTSKQMSGGHCGRDCWCIQHTDVPPAAALRDGAGVFYHAGCNNSEL